MTPLERDLARVLGNDAVASNDEAGEAGRYEHDSTEMEGLRGKPDAIVAPGSVESVQVLVAWCAKRRIPIIPRGGGTGFAGGAVPVLGGVVCSLGRLSAIRSFDPHLWRMETEAGATTERVQMLARKSGVMFPPNPGAVEQSQIGGNIATNAGGPRSFKYGVTGKFVTGLEAVIGEGELIRLGGPLRKDVAGYDLCHLLVGSEGTLGIIVSAWLRLVPAPEDVRVVVAGYPGIDEGVEALLRVPGLGLVPATLEFFDPACIEACRASFPGGLPSEARFVVMTECDGSPAESERLASEVVEALAPAATVAVISGRPQLAELERWRNGIGFAVRSQRGGKMSEDVAVPLEKLGSVIESTLEIGVRHGLPACSWGHAGDGNVHATFMIDATLPSEVERASQAAAELFATVLSLGGTVSGEHGLGWVKASQFERQFGPVEVRLQRDIKALFDPAGIFNPGKKVGPVSGFSS
ncbi:MAG: FAD-binding protein [Candidatus Dormibacteraeota bacterium]|nr:FAD-binding protein [Candidatus Dormibacteraeota bacterium]